MRREACRLRRGRFGDGGAEGPGATCRVQGRHRYPSGRHGLLCACPAGNTHRRILVRSAGRGDLHWRRARVRGPSKGRRAGPDQAGGEAFREVATDDAEGDDDNLARSLMDPLGGLALDLVMAAPACVRLLVAGADGGSILMETQAVRRTSESTAAPTIQSVLLWKPMQSKSSRSTTADCGWV